MNIFDVAKKAGVSKTTVSRVLNDNPSVTPEVRRRVKSAMAELDYVPPIRRRGPKPKRRQTSKTSTGTLGLLLYGRSRELLEQPYNARVLSGFMDEATKQGLSTVVVDMPNTSQIPPIIREGGLDGIAITGAGIRPNQAIVDAFNPLPCVWLGGNACDEAFMDQIIPHNRAAGRMAALYLLDQGRRNTAFLNDDPAHESFGVRADAFTAQIAIAGGSVISCVTEADRTTEMALRNTTNIRRDLALLLDRALAEAPDLDGIFVPTDQQVAILHQLLTERGITPGADIMTISCNNDRQWLATLHPQPATIDLRAATLGREAARRLAWRHTHPHDDATIIMVAPRLADPQGVNTTDGRDTQADGSGRSH